MAKKSTSTSFKDSSQNEALKNLAIVLGITILLVAGVVGAGLIISRVSDQSDNNTDQGTIASDNNNDAEVTEDGMIVDDGTTNPDDESFLDSDDLVFEDVTPPTANDNNDNGNDQTEQPVAVSTDVISQTASAGDSFSWLARRAMYQYMGERNRGLDVGGRLFFEVTLTNHINDGSLEAGERIEFTIAKLDEIFNSASNLDAVSHAAWIHQAEVANYL